MKKRRARSGRSSTLASGGTPPWPASASCSRPLSITADDVHGIGLTGQMHGLVLLDDAGQVLRPAILWNDQRTGAQCDTIRARLGKSHLIAITGNGPR